MGVIKKLIRQHKPLFGVAVFLTVASVFLSLIWNRFLMELLDRLADFSAFSDRSGAAGFLAGGIGIVLILAFAEFASYCMAAFVCESFAHDLRMGYVRYYVRSDVRLLSGLRAGEEQSAMQNELSDISNYFRENLFSFLKQFVTFAVTFLFLLHRNWKLTLLSTVPVFPLIAYCFFSGKTIKGYTDRCQGYQRQINGLADMILELFPVIWVYDAFGLIRDSMEERIRNWRDANIRKEKISARLMSLSGLLSFVPLLLLLGFGGTMTARGEISVGTFYIFINLSGNVSGFLQNMPNIYAGFRKFEASVDRLAGRVVLEKQGEKVCADMRSI